MYIVNENKIVIKLWVYRISWHCAVEFGEKKMSLKKSVSNRQLSKKNSFITPIKFNH